MVAEIEISFEDAAFGCEQQITYSRIESCPTCHGSGCKDGAQPETCTYCRGTGTVRTQQNFMGMTMQSQQPCPKCGGAGKIIKDPCQTCKGKGKVRHTKTLKVSVPAGIDNGQSFRVREEGNVGSNGGPNGDLLVTVSVRKHPPPAACTPKPNSTAATISGRMAFAAPKLCEIGLGEEVDDHIGHAQRAADLALHDQVIFARDRRDEPHNDVGDDCGDGCRHEERRNGHAHDLTGALGALHIRDRGRDRAEHRRNGDAEHQVQEHGAERLEHGRALDDDHRLAGTRRFTAGQIAPTMQPATMPISMQIRNRSFSKAPFFHGFSSQCLVHNKDDRLQKLICQLAAVRSEPRPSGTRFPRPAFICTSTSRSPPAVWLQISARPCVGRRQHRSEARARAHSQNPPRRALMGQLPQLLRPVIW